MSQRVMAVEQAGKLAKPKTKRKKQADYLARFAATPPAPELSDSERENQRALFERHDRAVVSLRLPLAPTLNNYRAIFQPPRGRARLITSAEGRAYFKAVEAAWLRHFDGWPPEPLTGQIRLLVVVHMARNGRSDVSNRIKALEDALTECGAWTDDSHIDDLHPIRGAVIPPTGAMDVIIEVIE